MKDTVAELNLKVRDQKQHMLIYCNTTSRATVVLITGCRKWMSLETSLWQLRIYRIDRCKFHFSEIGPLSSISHFISLSRNAFYSSIMAHKIMPSPPSCSSPSGEAFPSPMRKIATVLKPKCSYTCLLCSLTASSQMGTFSSLARAM